jgi:hypothetical protein
MDPVAPTVRHEVLISPDGCAASTTFPARPEVLIEEFANCDKERKSIVLWHMDTIAVKWLVCDRDDTNTKHKLEIERYYHEDDDALVSMVEYSRKSYKRADMKTVLDWTGAEAGVPLVKRVWKDGTKPQKSIWSEWCYDNWNCYHALVEVANAMIKSSLDKTKEAAEAHRKAKKPA